MSGEDNNIVESTFVDEEIEVHDAKINQLQNSTENIKTTETDVRRFQAGKALENMYPNENLQAESKKIAQDFDAHAGELAVSSLGARTMRSSTAERVLDQVRAYEMGPAQNALNSFTGVVKSVDPSVLSRRIKLFGSPIKAFLKSLQRVKTRLDDGRLQLEKQRKHLVTNISNLDGLEIESLDHMRDLLIVAHAAEIITSREENALVELENKDATNDLSHPQRVDNQRVLVARLNRRTLDLKAAALRALLQTKVADAGQKALVVLHDDLQFASTVLHQQFVSEVAAAIILYQGKKAGEKSQDLRSASADLAKSTGDLLGEVTEKGTSYLTDASEDLRALTTLRDSVVKWSERTVEVANLARQTRESAEEQMQEISKSLQVASRSFSTN